MQEGVPWVLLILIGFFLGYVFEFFYFNEPPFLSSENRILEHLLKFIL